MLIELYIIQHTSHNNHYSKCEKTFLIKESMESIADTNVANKESITSNRTPKKIILKKHIEKNHIDQSSHGLINEVNCEICDYQPTCSIDLTNHTKTNHLIKIRKVSMEKLKTSKYPKCMFITTHTTALDAHIEKAHQLKFDCELCPFSSSPCMLKDACCNNLECQN